MRGWREGCCKCKRDRWGEGLYRRGEKEGCVLRRRPAGAHARVRSLGRHFDRFFGTLLSAVAAFLAVMPTTSKIQVQRSTTAGSARLSFFSLPTIPHDGFSQKRKEKKCPTMQLINLLNCFIWLKTNKGCSSAHRLGVGCVDLRSLVVTHESLGSGWCGPR